MHNERKVIYLRDVDPERALEALMRLTGLEWDQMPESLVNAATPIQVHPAPQASQPEKRGTGRLSSVRLSG